MFYLLVNFIESDLKSNKINLLRNINYCYCLTLIILIPLLGILSLKFKTNI